MEHINFNPDYYPVFMDLSVKYPSMAQEQRCLPEEIPEQEYAPSRRYMFSAPEVIEASSGKGFTLFQTTILLVKNAFEGHVFMTRQLRPNQLMETGTIFLRGKCTSLVALFCEQLDQFMNGLTHAWELLKREHPALNDVSIESLIYSIIVNQMIRPPVTIWSQTDIMNFREFNPGKTESLRRLFELMATGEHALGDLLFIERVNLLYEEKFREGLKKVQRGQEIRNHYEKKRVMAYDPSIKTEEELDAFMYECLVKSRLHHDSSPCPVQPLHEGSSSPVSVTVISWLNKRSRILYRTLSKNCCEIHNSTLIESPYPELHRIFLTANSVYNDPVFEVYEVLIKYFRLAHLFAEVTVYREENGLDEVRSMQPETGASIHEDFFDPGILKDCSKTLREIIATKRASNYSDFKMRNLMGDDMAEIHQLFLEKEAEYLDEQISTIQQEISEIMEQKSGCKISVQS